MKLVAVLVLSLFGSSAFAKSLVLNCDGQPNLIFEGVRQITIDSKDIQVLEETKKGAYLGWPGQPISQTAASATYYLRAGVTVSIPAELMQGKAPTGTVQFSTTDYPYETSVCSLAK